MKSIISTFALRFAAMVVVLSAPDGFARDPNSVSLCPPSSRMTEHDGCQKSSASTSGSLPAHVKDDAAEQIRKEIATLVNNTPREIQSCVWMGSLGGDPVDTLDQAKAKILRCQNEKQAFALIKNTSTEIQSCVWRGPHDNWTQDKAEVEISKCKRQATAGRFALACILLTAGTLLLTFLIRFRARIATGLYNLFVRYLALRLRFNRSRKQFLDGAIREAANRLDCPSQRPPLE
jgi:hypothetical protein